MASAKPRVLILGGCGFIGRNLVHYLVTNNLCSKIRIVDKVFPHTAYLNAAHTESFANEVCEFIQGNLINDASIRKIFTDEAGGPFTFVFQLAAETKYGQTENVYKEKVLDLVTKCATEAQRQGVQRFIEVSTSQIYDGSSKAKKEDGKVKPWTHIAEYKHQGEEALKAMTGLPVVIVRPAMVYGPGDVQGVSPRLIIGAVYKQLAEEMVFLWSRDLRTNTVHVQDVVRALWHLTSNGEVGRTYNLADKTDTTQETLGTIISRIFGIEVSYLGSVKSQFAKMNLKGITDDVNEKHLKPWSDLCRAAGIENTPLTPYLDLELLYNNDLSVDGTAIEATGFAYEHPQVTEELIRAQLEYFTSQGIFPTSVLSSAAAK